MQLTREAGTRPHKTLTLLAVAAIAQGCHARVQERTIAGIVAEIDKRAKANDTAFFSGYLDASYRGQEARLIKMVNASGMLTNYKSHLSRASSTSARLGYCGPGTPGCHFQVDLKQTNGLWSIERIWFCR